MRRMEKIKGDSPPLTSWHSSPRSTLGWKDAWGNESAGMEPTKCKPPVSPSHTRSKSLVGLSSPVISEGSKTPSLQFETMVGPSPTRCKSFIGLPSRANPDGPKTPPLQLERRLFRSLSPNANRRVSGTLPIPESPSNTNGPATPEAEQLYTNSPQTSILGTVQLAANERGHGTRPFESWELACRQDRPTDVFSPPPFSRARSAVCASAREHDESSVSNPGEDIAARGQKVSSSNRMQFISSLNEELLSMKSCLKRAIDLGKKVQHDGALEVSQLRGDKANAVSAIQKTVLVNRELEQQVTTLRDEVQKLQWERELEVLSMTNEIQELQMERNTFMKAAREEKKKRENLQSEVDSILSVLLEEKMKLESEREANDTALQIEKKKLQAMRKARDGAEKALEEGNKKLEVERDAMLLAVRDLTSRLDFERDAKLRSMRRTSLDMATMMSGLRSSGNRRPSISLNDNGTPRSRPLSRQNSKQFQ